MHDTELGAAYTHAVWRVRPGQEDAFVAAWRAIGEAFAALPRRPLWGTLLRSEREPGVFYSFGPWASAADVEAMRADPAARAAIARAMELCAEATPGACTLVAHMDLRSAAPTPAA
jgi:quinol monooxygenase YgiN